MPIRRPAGATGAFALVLLLATVAARGADPVPEGVVDESFALPSGERVLQMTTLVDVPVAVAWDAFTTDAGFQAWAVPLARIDLRVGGSIESSYDAKIPLGSGKTIRNEIVALVPERLLVIRNVQAPQGVPFDVATFQQTQTAMLFQPVDATRSRITLLSGRFPEGPRHDGVYKFFFAGNAYTLGELRRHLAKPPGPAR